MNFRNYLKILATLFLFINFKVWKKEGETERDRERERNVSWVL